MADKKNSQELDELMEKQQEYWKKRATNEYIAGEKDAYETAKQLKDIYDRTKLQLERQINMFYGKYAKDNQITLEEAKQQLNAKELKDYQTQLQEYIDAQKSSDKEISELEKMKARLKVTRWDELKTELEYYIDKLTVDDETLIEEFLDEIYLEGLYKTTYNIDRFKGFTKGLNSPNPEYVKKAVNTKYMGANYSDRIWQNEKNLLNVLNNEIPRGLALGYNPKKLSKLITDKVDSNYNNVVRLIRTEYNKVLNDSTIAGYAMSGIKQYKILATLDHRTSEICQMMDSEIFDVSEAETGVTCPPFHPNCYDKETEVYTNNGWKLFKDLSMEDLVYTINPRTLETEYLEPKNYIKYKITGYMYNYTTKDIDLCVTGHHRMFIKEKNKGFMFVPAWRLLNFEGYLFNGDKKSQKYIPINELTLQRINYDDYVYCVELEKYNTLLVRRNGQVCWCGNCRTTTIPYFEPDEFDKEKYVTREEYGKTYTMPTDISYAEWKQNFIDTDEKTKQEFEFEKTKARNESADREQYNRYKAVINSRFMPKSFSEFQELKYKNPRGYEILKDEYKASK